MVAWMTRSMLALNAEVEKFSGHTGEILWRNLRENGFRETRTVVNPVDGAFLPRAARNRKPHVFL